MTSPTPDNVTPPPGLLFGYVVGEIIEAIGDTSADPDALPDTIGAVGVITFRPVITIIRITGERAVTVAQQGYGANIDAKGIVRDRVGQEGVWLVTGQYEVSFNLVNGAVIPSYFITVTEDHTELNPLDLSRAAPLTPAPNERWVVNEQIYQDTLNNRNQTLAFRNETQIIRDQVLAEKASMIISAMIVDGHLFFTNVANTTFDAGYVLGPPGNPGQDGQDGNPGQDGQDGEQGDPGLSAYELALLEGFTGTLPDWLTSLRGEKGDPGNPGDPGEPGEDGSSAVTDLMLPRHVTGAVELSFGYQDWWGEGAFSGSADRVAGVGSLQIVLNSNNRRSLAWYDGALPGDLSSSTIRIRVKASTWNQVDMQIRLYSDYASFFYVSVANAFASTERAAGEWLELNIPRSAFQADGTPSWNSINHLGLSAWTMHATETPTVWFNHLTIHPDGAGSAVAITFDDQFNSMMVGAEIMDEFGYVGNAFIIPDEIGISGRATQADIDSLHERGWFIGGHAGTNLTQVSPEEAESRVRESAEYLAEHGYRGATHFAYPNGAHNNAIRKIVRKYFRTGRGISPISNPTGWVSEFHINATSVWRTMNINALNTMLDTAVANNEFMVFCFHKIDTTTDELGWSPTMFRAFLTRIKNLGVPVVPLGIAAWSRGLPGPAGQKGEPGINGTGALVIPRNGTVPVGTPINTLIVEMLT